VNVASQQSCVPLVVLTGFLGSGKTTLLNRVLADPSMRDTAVVVNEFGEIGIDHLLVESAADDVVLLASGCVCCSAGDDFGAALASMLAKRGSGALPPFRRIVLETSGIADPGPILQRLLADGTLAAQIRIHAVVTVVDAVFGGGTMSSYGECANQVAMANRLVLSKLDLVGRGELDSLLDRLRSTNPAASLVFSGRDEPPAFDILFGNIGGGLAGDTGGGLAGDVDGGLAYDTITPLRHHSIRPSAAPDHTNRYSTFWLRWNEPTHWEDFKAWLEGLLIARGDSILRMKGVLQVEGRARPVVVQGVQHALYPPKELARWPQEVPRSEVVFVTRDFSRDAARRSLLQFFPRLIVT
jgi:G3E family GTPase